MALRDVIEALNLSDEEKATLLAEHEGEIAPLRADNRKEKVESEVTALSELLPSGYLALYRRVLMSDDEQPGIVLLADDTNRSKEEVSTAEVARRLTNALITTVDGKRTLAAEFADMGLAIENGNGGGEVEDETTDDDKAKDAKRARVSKALGREVKKRDKSGVA